MTDRTTPVEIIDLFNTPPTILTTIPNQIRQENTPTWTIDLTPFESDSQDSGTDLNWSVSGVDTALISAAITDVDNDMLAITPVADATGSDNITLSLSDADGLTVSQDVKVTLIASQTLNNKPKIAAGWHHTVVCKTDGTVWAWGGNYSSELGDGSTTTRLTPVHVTGVSDVIAVSAGSEHSIALKSDGTVWAWGGNRYGQSGTGSVSDRIAIPRQLPGISDVISVSAGSYHTIALKNDGTVWAWGRNLWGQLGDGTSVDRLIPVQVTGISDVISISAGYQYSLALKSDGTL